MESENSVYDPDTVFVLVTDEPYFHRAKKTIQELRGRGEWIGDIVCISVGFSIDFTFKRDLGVIEKKFEAIDKENLIRKIGDGFPGSDGRERTKLTQWEKLHVFDDYFKRWKRVAYLDAGMRVFDSVKYLLSLDYKDSFLCPDDNTSPQKRAQNVFRSQISNKDPELFEQLVEEYGEEILEADNFLNCIWVYDTNLLNTTITKTEFIEVMNKYPLFLTNEMGVMALLLAMKYKVWKTFPRTIISDKGKEKYLFDWCELNRPGTNWTDFCLIKYSSTMG